MSESLYGSVVDLPLVHAGKVRELYAIGDDRLLMVATDKISAFDFVLTPPIPDKGEILTRMSLWWFDQLRDVENHVVSTDVPEAVAGRAVICEKLEMIEIECVARGYLMGSGWAEYERTRTVCGIELPIGMQNGSRLPEPIFTPATKAPIGEHDENIDFDETVRRVGRDTAEQIRDLTLKIYRQAESYASERGIILADTKFEFGRRADGTIVLADEVLTPDSSRFVDAETWQPGVRIDSYDKQFLRNWLTDETDWDRASNVAPPPLPEEIVAATRQRYVEAYEALTQQRFR
ncbi:phosphoribosylaminoimidazole-succinocarboxamide synthase [Microlunatus endophyticus]|uniref:Phosphoribosylaminoimidazole-succinocarboxamide synthase n=1 Tax=Microlunatus endophyticus TaxID=1716077 RepID=A0A917SB24_9ACTN|nr:phosphoribosylaminoimidazolesuccinocarboxamide synthase [Microlunatus endophyticus]GGL64318.1 phosphoribosylaminoimidazole-succinocarboxamide synthase [Microlunatus endophyticus]